MLKSVQRPPPANGASQSFFFRYHHFAVLLVNSQSALDHLEWCGLVESKIRLLINNLERNPHIASAHVNPECFQQVQHLQAPFGSMWFIGLEFEKVGNLNVDLTEGILGFAYAVYQHADSIKMLKNGMQIETRHVRRKELSQYLDKEFLNRQHENTAPFLMPLIAGKKRLSSNELQSASLKKGRFSE